MCLIRRTEITYSDGHRDTKDDPLPCAPAANGQPCPRTEVRVTTERSTHSRSSSSFNRPIPTLIHQRDPPRQPRYYDSIRIGLKGLRSPTYSLRRVSQPTRSLERYEGPSYHDAQAIPPRAPTPPPPDNRDLRLRPTTFTPLIHSVPVTTNSTPTTTSTSNSQSYRTIDTQPSSHTPSTTSNSRPREARPRPSPIRTSVIRYAYTPTDNQALAKNTTPPSLSNHIPTTSHKSPTPGISRLRSNTSRHDSARGSGNLSPTSPVSSPSHAKPDVRASSASRSEGKKPELDAGRQGMEIRRYNDRYNYTNDYSSDEEERDKPPTLRSVPRVGERLRGDPEDTREKMRRAEVEARGYQAAGVGGEGRDGESVVVEFEGKDGVSGRRRRRRHGGSHGGSHGHRRHDSGSGSGENKRK